MSGDLGRVQDLVDALARELRAMSETIGNARPLVDALARLETRWLDESDLAAVPPTSAACRAPVAGIARLAQLVQRVLEQRALVEETLSIEGTFRDRKRFGTRSDSPRSYRNGR